MVLSLHAVQSYHRHIGTAHRAWLLRRMRFLTFIILFCIVGEFWSLIYEEYKLSKLLILKLSDFKELMENEPANKASIETREKIVLPLITIQQYALRKIKDIEKGNLGKETLKIYEKMVTRSLFGNINASRNSA